MGTVILVVPGLAVSACFVVVPGSFICSVGVGMPGVVEFIKFVEEILSVFETESVIVVESIVFIIFFVVMTSLTEAELVIVNESVVLIGFVVVIRLVESIFVLVKLVELIEPASVIPSVVEAR